MGKMQTGDKEIAKAGEGPMSAIQWMKLESVVMVAGIMGAFGCAQQPTQMADGALPRYNVDPFWPKPLKDIWIWGQVSRRTSMAFPCQSK